MQIGEDVAVTEGPFAGLVGRLAGRSEQRVVIVIQLPGRELDVEMDLDWIALTAPQRKSVASVAKPKIELRRSDQA